MKDISLAYVRTRLVKLSEFRDQVVEHLHSDGISEIDRLISIVDDQLEDEREPVGRRRLLRYSARIDEINERIAEIMGEVADAQE